MPTSELIDVVLRNTKPLEHTRGNRLPLYLWPLMDIDEDEAETERLILELDRRGIAVITTWDHRHETESLDRGLRIAGIQKKLGLLVNINATPLLHHFFNSDPETAHRTDTGEPFFDTSFSDTVKIGCPFALEHRYPDIESRVESFAKEYRRRGLEVGFAFADWEVDGPIEWNDAWQASKRCSRCREHVPNIEDFTAFQTTIRAVRSDMQRRTYADVLRAHFPNVLVGNYAVYPHDGYRYWYDYFERFVEGAPHKRDQRAVYRQWAREFPLTSYTVAMPVVYTWYPTFSWYDFESSDYRWFYNMLLVASNAGEHTAADVPIVPFVHWHTTAPPSRPDPGVKQLSERIYQDLLWHMLLRGHDTFFLWCLREETADEVRLVHEVYAAALEYREFLDDGTPVTFHVPETESPVVSGLRLGDRVLVRRTDFTDHPTAVPLRVGEQTVQVPRIESQCQVLTIE